MLSYFLFEDCESCDTTKATSASLNQRPGGIVALPHHVVNRIAAGEVIQRPVNVVKELMENSLDAGARSIQISLRQSGTKWIQILDDGGGIKKEDFPLVCQRFATSKLKEFSDLRSISTFGFRGEALASVSYVARVSITSRTPDNVCAYRAHFSNGVMEDKTPRPCAGNIGTCVVVEDLFHNCPQRARALSTPREELQRLLEVVRRYAVHNYQVAFGVSRLDEAATPLCDLKTPMGHTDVKQRLAYLYGSQLGEELLKLQHRDERLHYEVNGYLSHPNYQYTSRSQSASSTSRSSLNSSTSVSSNSNNVSEFILFLNHRLVECSPLRKALDAVYSNILPKRTQAFIYLSLQLPAYRVDVNVHPTKHEVFFLHTEAIVASLQAAVEAVLMSSHQSRSFIVHQPCAPLSPVSSPPEASNGEVDRPREKEEVEEKVDTPREWMRLSSGMDDEVRQRTLEEVRTVVKQRQTEICQANLIRTDRTQRKLPSFFTGCENVAASPEPTAVPVSAPPPPPSPAHLPKLSTLWEHPLATKPAQESAMNPVSSSSASSTRKPLPPDSTDAEDEDFINCPNVGSEPLQDRTNRANHSSSPIPDLMPLEKPPGFREFQLTSLKSLRRSVEESVCPTLRRMFHHLTFVGCVDREWMLAQSEEDLVLVNVRKCSQHFFYQLALQQFGNMGHLKLDTPPCLHHLLDVALQSPFSHYEEKTLKSHRDELLASGKRRLLERANMLADYFGLTLDTTEERLVTLPYLLTGYVPDLDALPLFLLRLAVNVCWTEEKACFHSFCTELAIFYSAKFSLFPDTEDVRPLPVEQPVQSLDNENDTAGSEKQDNNWKWRTEHVLLPALKCAFLPPKQLWKESAIVKVTSLSQLYRVFERC